MTNAVDTPVEQTEPVTEPELEPEPQAAAGPAGTWIPPWGTPWTGPVNPFDRSLWRRLVLPLAVVLLLAGWVVLREADRLVSGLVNAEGESASIGDVTGILSVLHTDAWGKWASSDLVGQLPVFVGGYLVGDLLFMAGYFFLLWVFFAWSRIAVGALIAALVVDGIEGVLLLVGALLVSVETPADPLPQVLAWVSATKWILLALMLLAGLLTAASRRSLAGRWTRGLVAGWAHRLTVIFVAGVGLLALSPFSGIFDQLPDVQRAWFGDGSSFVEPVRPILGAFALLLIAAILYWYFGRRRTERVYRRFLESREWEPGEPTITWWVAVPVGALAVAVLATCAGSDLWLLSLVTAVCLVLVGAAAYWAQLSWKGDTTRLRWLGAGGSLAIIALLGIWAWVAQAGELLDAVYLVVVFSISVVVIVLSVSVRWLQRKGCIAEPDVPFTSSDGVDRFVEVGSQAPEWGPSTGDSDWGADGFAAERDAAMEKGRATLEGTGSAAPTPRAEVVRTSWLVGDALAVMVVALAPLGLVRSLTGPALANAALLAAGTATATDSPTPTPTSTSVAAAADLAAGVPAVWFWLVVGLVYCGVLVGAAVVAVHAVDRAMVGEPPQNPSLRRYLIDPRLNVPENVERRVLPWDAAAVAVGALVIGFATFFPVEFAGLGPVGVTVVLLTAWSLVVGGIILSMQRGKPLPVFRQLGLNAAPIIVIVTLFMFLMSLFAVPAEVHGVRTIDEPTAPRTTSAKSADERLTEALTSRFKWWLRHAPECEGAPTPLLLVAAEGGGGRAAYWTVDAMKTLHSAGCLGPAMFVASGISGGSVGLAVDQVVGAREGDTVSSITKLTSADSLARVVTGLLAGDFVAAITGVRVPTIDNGWLDRAGHLEVAWEDSVGELKEPFDQRALAGHPFLILNSADSVSGCRVSVTQLPVAGAPDWKGHDRLSADDCGAPTTGAGFALEFDEVWRDCSRNLPWSTTAMLSARFPFVTPGGRMPVPDGYGCSGIMNSKDDPIPQAQLVDGGYSDGSGLGALADLMPEIVKLVADHNACVERVGPTPPVASPHLCGSPQPVMPVVVYLKNDRGFEVDANVERLAAEFLVPLAGAKAKGLQNSEEAWLQRLADDLDGFAAVVDCGKSPICDRPVVVVSAATSPTIAAPLGWTLSKFSRDSLESALKANAARCGMVDDYPTLGELLSTFASGPCKVSG